VVASLDGAAKVFDAASGKLLAIIVGPESNTAAFSADGKKIVTADYDNSAKVWDVHLEMRGPEEIAEIVKRRVPLSFVDGRLTQGTSTKVSTKQTEKPSSSRQPESTDAANSELLSRPELLSYGFERIKLDQFGKVVERRRAEASYYAEELGSGVRMDMVFIPGGSFLMGSSESEANRLTEEGPQHEVRVEQFYMGKYEVTQKQWKAVMGYNPSFFKGEELPVENVSWYEAMEFCKLLSERTGRSYSLPTEAQWEYASRSGRTTAFGYGETITTEIANYNGELPYRSAPKGENRAKTIAVGSLGAANGFGLYDMSGNVWEWCLDWYHETYEGAPVDGSAWVKPAGKYWVLRGGSWSTSALYCRAGTRRNNSTGKRNSNFGFRVVASENHKDTKSKIIEGGA
jgi:formylglycine-generating enzyme required for sulfatase activity